MTANDLSAFTPEIWAKRMQIYRSKKMVAMATANVELKADLYIGDTAHKPYPQSLKDDDYTKGSDVDPQDVAPVDESLVVDQAKVVPTYVDDLDKVQNKWDAAAVNADIAQKRLNGRMDGAVQDQYSNAASSLDDGDVAGTAGNYIALTTSNIGPLFTSASAKLDYWDVDDNKRAVMLPPRAVQKLKDLLSNKDTNFGDEVGRNGYIGKWGGFKCYKNNHAPFSASLNISVIPTADDTITIAGVVLTAVANGTAASAGEFSIGVSATAAIDNIVLLINGTGTPGLTTYIDVSADDREKLRRVFVAATDADPAITIAGYGEVVVSQDFTAGANIWSLQRQHFLFLEEGAIDLVVQLMPRVQFNQAQLRAGKFMLALTLYGIKAFKQGTRALIDTRIDASDWT